MLSLPVAVRIFVFTGVTDMRKSFDGLAALVEQHLRQDPESGHLYVFFNRRRDRAKLLFWQGDGLVIWYKRLEKAVFPEPRAGRTSSEPSGEQKTPSSVELRAGELAMLLDGVDPTTVVRRKRHRRAG
jgi:transposase